MQKIVGIYGETYLGILLKNKQELERLYEESYKAREGIESTNQEVENIQTAVEFYVMNKILSGKLDSESLENYKKVFNKMIRQDIMSVFRNPILKLPEQKLTPIIDEEVYSFVQKRKSVIEKKCKEIYSKDNKKVTNEEREFLLDYLQANIGTRNKEIIAMQEDLIYDLLTKKRNYGYKETEFVVNFIATEEMKKYDLEGYCHLSDYQAGTITKFEGTKKSSICDLSTTINREFGIKALNDKEDLGKLIYTICYQIKKLKQIDDIQTRIRNEETINALTDNILNEFLPEDKKEYYKRNHYLDSAEMNAQMVGYNNAITYLRKYGMTGQASDLLDEKDAHIYKVLSEKQHQEEQKESSEQYKYREINSLVKEHPKLLSKYPQLQTIYNQDGTPKSLQQLLIEKGKFKRKNKEDNPNIYHSTINVLIDKNELAKLDFSSMNQEEIYKVMHALSEQYNYYANASHNYLSAKAIGEEFGSQNGNTKDNLDKNIDIMKSRYQKIETVLDILYDRFGEKYKQKKEYKQDQFMYQANKLYARYQFHKINKHRKSVELSEMIEESPKEKPTPTQK